MNPKIEVPAAATVPKGENPPPHKIAERKSRTKKPRIFEQKGVEVAK